MKIFKVISSNRLLFISALIKSKENKRNVKLWETLWILAKIHILKCFSWIRNNGNGSPKCKILRDFFGLIPHGELCKDRKQQRKKVETWEQVGGSKRWVSVSVEDVVETLRMKCEREVGCSWKEAIIPGRYNMFLQRQGVESRLLELGNQGRQKGRRTCLETKGHKCAKFFLFLL